jgi:hypothetical protein
MESLYPLRSSLRKVKYTKAQRRVGGLPSQISGGCQRNEKKIIISKLEARKPREQRELIP